MKLKDDDLMKGESCRWRRGQQRRFKAKDRKKEQRSLHADPAAPANLRLVRYESRRLHCPAAQ